MDTGTKVKFRKVPKRLSRDGVISTPQTKIDLWRNKHYNEKSVGLTGSNPESQQQRSLVKTYGWFGIHKISSGDGV